MNRTAKHRTKPTSPWAVPLVSTLLGLATAATAPAAEPAVTFNKDIAPLVFENCSGCHRPGEVAPFSLLNYRDVSKRAGQIKEAVASKAMPPWKAEPGASGHFADERRLTDAQIATLSRWVDAGTPEGDAADLPPTPKFAAGWRLGEPDAVVKMAEAYPVPAEGPDEYRCFVLPLQIPEGKYLKAVEYRPGNRKVVHHAVLTALPHRMAEAKLAKSDGKSFGSGLAPPGKLLPGPLAIWTPGMEPRPTPKGLAYAWPEGNDLVLQLHLHPDGKAEEELSSIGLHFTDEKPTAQLRLMTLAKNRLDIPPDKADYEVEASMTIRSPVDVYGLFPHMHLIGHTVRLTATLPDGKTLPLLSIGDWDFNWQFYYQLESPLRLPAGTKLQTRWTYDNSASNPANPSRPPKRVTYGEQTTDEMAFMLMDVLPVKDDKPADKEGK